MTEGLSVGDVADLTGLSVRTLHHYDEVGLVVPEERTPAGHRRYGPDSLSRLHRVLAYRELDFSLLEIGVLLDNPHVDADEQLREQRRQLQERIVRLTKVRDTIDKVLEARRMGINLDPQEMLEVFGDESPGQYAEEAEQRWGDTDAYAESQRRTSRMSKDDWLQVRAEQDEVMRHIVEVFDAGESSSTPAAMDAVDAHRLLIAKWFYPCSRQMHVNLGQMYVADDRFKQHYEEQRQGLAKYVHDAIAANALREP